MPIACHTCPDHKLVDDDKVKYYLWNGGPAIKDDAKGVIHIGPSVTTEAVPGSFPVCPECLAKLLEGE
jgi:hypothetical protein